jgi:hypothetical protein
MIDAFAQPRHADLWAGTGLAATYAGGADEAELNRLWQRAGRYRPQLAQGSAFAAGARVRAHLVVPHNEVATQVLCGMTPAEAAKVTDDVFPDRSDHGDVPAYETWRQRIADELASVGRS